MQISQIFKKIDLSNLLKILIYGYLQGYHQPSAGQSSCDPCPAGKYQDEVKQTTCKDCLEGHYSAGGSATCTPCDAVSLQLFQQKCAILRVPNFG